MNEVLKHLAEKYKREYFVELVQNQKWNGLIDYPVFTTIFLFSSLTMTHEYSVMVKFNKRISDGDGAEIEWYIKEVSRRFEHYRNQKENETNGKQ